MAAAKLEYIQSGSLSGAKPLVVHFTNGGLKRKQQDKVKFGLYQWADAEDRRKRQRLTLLAEADEMEYIGQNFGQFSRSSHLCKYLVGVYNKKTEVMKMYDAEMITLQPQILYNETVENEEEQEKMELSLCQKNDRLIQAFGSSKKKRAMSSRLQNQIETENLNNTVSGCTENLVTETDGIDQQNSNIPPFDANAETVPEVYKFDDIITPLEYEALKRSATELQDSKKENIKTWRDQKRFPEYVLQHLEVLSLNPSQRLHQSCCLLYLTFMIRLYNLNYKDLKAKDPLPEVPAVVKDQLFSLFSLKKGKYRAVPKRLKNKLVSYILVLALMIDEFSLDFTSVMKELKMSPTRLRSHALAIGCVIESTKGQQNRNYPDGNKDCSKKIVLRLPLPQDFSKSISLAK